MPLTPVQFKFQRFSLLLPSFVQFVLTFFRIPLHPRLKILVTYFSVDFAYNTLLAEAFADSLVEAVVCEGP